MEKPSYSSPHSQSALGEKLETPSKLRAAKIVKNLSLNEKLSFVPQKLIGFPMQSPKKTQNLPQLSPKLASPKQEYFLLNRKQNMTAEDPYHQNDSYFTEITHPDLATRSNFANGVISKDKIGTKIDFKKKKGDVSYLMETRNSSTEKPISRLPGDNPNRSLNCVSPDATSSSFAQKNLHSSIDSKATSPDKDNIYLQMKSFLKPTANLPTDYNQIKNLLFYEGAHSKKDSSLLTEQPTITYPKTIDAFKVGYGPDAYVETRDTSLKIGLEKVRNRKLVEHRAQNKHLLSPSGRKEVLDLSEWLNNMLDKISNEKTLPVSGIFENVQLIYTVCLKEIIRQVKVQCLERGQLLDKIWEAYIDLLDRAINENSNDRIKMENHYLDEIAALHSMYQKQLEFHILNVEKLKKETDEQIALSATRKEQLKYVQKKNRKFNNEMKRLKEEIENLKLYIENTTFENIEIKTLLTNAGINYEAKPPASHNNITTVNKNPTKKKEGKQEIFYEVFDTKKDFNLFENLNLIDKLEEELEGRDLMDQGAFDDEVDVQEDGELYCDIAVDTAGLISKNQACDKEFQDKEVQCEETQRIDLFRRNTQEEGKKDNKVDGSESSLSSQRSHDELVRRQQEEGEGILLSYFHDALVNATKLSIPIEALEGITDNDLLSYFRGNSRAETQDEDDGLLLTRNKITLALLKIFNDTANAQVNEDPDNIEKVLQAFARSLLKNSQLQFEIEEQEAYAKTNQLVTDNIDNTSPDNRKQ